MLLMEHVYYGPVIILITSQYSCSDYQPFAAVNSQNNTYLDHHQPPPPKLNSIVVCRHPLLAYWPLVRLSSPSPPWPSKKTTKTLVNSIKYHTRSCATQFFVPSFNHLSTLPRQAQRHSLLSPFSPNRSAFQYLAFRSIN